VASDGFPKRPLELLSRTALRVHEPILAQWGFRNRNRAPPLTVRNRPEVCRTLPRRYEHTASVTALDRIELLVVSFGVSFYRQTRPLSGQLSSLFISVFVSASSASTHSKLVRLCLIGSFLSLAKSKD
jgi:hypothetical protein